MVSTIIAHPLSGGSSEHTHNRRTILARLATASAVAAAPAAAIAGEVDPHPAWLSEWQGILRWSEAGGAGNRDLGDTPEWQRLEELSALIGTTPAATLVGAATQVRYACICLERYGSVDDDAEEGLGLALATLDRLAGGQARG